LSFLGTLSNLSTQKPISPTQDTTKIGASSVREGKKRKREEEKKGGEESKRIREPFFVSGTEHKAIDTNKQICYA